VDLSARTIELLKQSRPADICIHSAVSDHSGAVQAYVFNQGHSAVNTLDKSFADHLSQQNGSKYVETEIPVTTLTHILDEHASEKEIDFLNIDVESFEMEVLRGLDFSR